MRYMWMFIIAALSFTVNAKSTTKYYGTALCKASKDYNCRTIKKSERWETLWKDKYQRDLVRRINRTNQKLRPGMVIAVPQNIKEANMWNTAPFPTQIDHEGGKLIIVDQKKLAWGAFNKDGELQWWGPISTGRDKCSDSNKRCNTVTGKFYVFEKRSKECKSRAFPIGRGGARMPYCMFFYRGFALHGSSTVPGYRDSHGCVRMYTKDAKWLNEQYIDLPNEESGYPGTKVIIKELII